MVEKVERYRTRHGKEMISEESALIEEAVDSIVQVIPELTMLRLSLSANIKAISTATFPLAQHYRKTTPEVYGENHPERPPCRMGIDIPVMAPGDKIEFAPSDKPKWDNCGATVTSEKQEDGSMVIVGWEDKPTPKISRLWLDGKAINPLTGDPCPYNHPAMTTCPHCTGWTYNPSESSIPEKGMTELGYEITKKGQPRSPVADDFDARVAEASAEIGTRLVDAIKSMQNLGAPAKDWLRRYGFEDVLDFNNRANLDLIVAWERFAQTSPEDAICDCSALMNGDTNHSPTCITQTKRRFGPITDEKDAYGSPSPDEIKSICDKTCPIVGHHEPGCPLYHA